MTTSHLPIIGVTPDEGASIERPGRPSRPRYELKRNYVAAIEAAGGLPVILPYVAGQHVEQFFEFVNAVVVTGGAWDIDPAHYKAPRHPKLGEVNSDRTGFEYRLMEAALKRGLPVLGICGGMQLLNVVRGGTLIQDIGSERPEALPHEQPHDPQQPGHDVTIVANSLLGRTVGTRAAVNSTHHQAIDRLGSGLVVTARGPDGMIEAVEDPLAKFVVGVQWHPELLSDDASRSIFRAFVSAAQ